MSTKNETTKNCKKNDPNPPAELPIADRRWRHLKKAGRWLVPRETRKSGGKLIAHFALSGAGNFFDVVRRGSDLFLIQSFSFYVVGYRSIGLPDVRGRADNPSRLKATRVQRLQTNIFL